jgi:hypothetical protein
MLSQSSLNNTPMPTDKLVQQPFSDLTTHIQGMTHEYNKFISKPTKASSTRLRKHLSSMTKSAKIMRGGILEHIKLGLPSIPTSNQMVMPISTPEIVNEVKQAQVETAVNSGKVKRIGKMKLPKPTK